MSIAAELLEALAAVYEDDFVRDDDLLHVTLHGAFDVGFRFVGPLKDEATEDCKLEFVTLTSELGLDSCDPDWAAIISRTAERFASQDDIFTIIEAVKEDLSLVKEREMHHGQESKIASAQQSQTVDATPRFFRCVFMLDHMNSPKTYVNALESFCRSTECSLQMRAKTPEPNLCNFRDLREGQRVVDVHACLTASSPEQISLFLKLLKTENVDVDSKKRACKERKSKVLLPTFIVPQGEVASAEEQVSMLSFLLLPTEREVETWSAGFCSAVASAGAQDTTSGRGASIVLHGLRDCSGGVQLEVRVQPGKSCTYFHMEGHLLVVELAAQAKDGEANAELVRALSKALGLPQKSVSVVSGQKHRNKVLKFEGITTEESRGRILAAVEADR